ncbi:MAG: hypothetical protein ACXVKA_14120 [Acidimicrobiia bacterium]
MTMGSLRARGAKACVIGAVAIVMLGVAGNGAAASVTPQPSPPMVVGPKVVKQLVPPQGQRRFFAPLAAQRLFLHSRKAHGPVANSPKVYLVFWGSQWSSDPANAAPVLQSFFQGLGGPDDAWSNVMSQYCSKPAKTVPLPSATCDAKSKYIVHPATTPLAGVWFDNTAPAPHAASFTDLALEAVKTAKHFGRTSAILNRDVQYVIASPSGTQPDGFPTFCAYHTATKVPKVLTGLPKSLGALAWTNLPYVPDLNPASCSALPSSGPLDGYLIAASHEYSETVTDFVPGTGWYGTNFGDGDEIADVCDTTDGFITLNTGTFAVESLFSNAASACRFG